MIPRLAPTAGVLLCLSLALAGAAGAAAPGDVSLDGLVDDTDAVLLERHLQGGLVLGCAEQLAADVALPEGTLDAVDLALLSDPVARAALPSEPELPPFVQPITTPPAGSRDVRLMSFNLRLGDDPPVNTWLDRRPLVFDVLSEHRPDVIALQEAQYDREGPFDPANPLATQKTNDILHQFPEYALVDLVGSGLYADRILYRHERFEVESRDIHLVPDADGNDIKCALAGYLWNRFISWARLVDRVSGDGFYVYDVHLCASSAAVRQAHAIALVDLIAGRSHPEDPVVVLGDFNEDENGGTGNASVQFMKGLTALFFGSEVVGNPHPMDDSFRLFDPDTVVRGTFNGFSQNPASYFGVLGRKIDYVFVAPEIEVCAAAIDHRWQVVDPDAATLQYTFPSDHYAVTALVQLRGGDADGDGVVDANDNCPEAANPTQADADADGHGDACEYPCQDGLDNDGDGLVDFPDDPGCISELGYETAVCDDGLDNDGDGWADAFGIDLDGDGDFDDPGELAPDPGCNGAGWRPIENPECQDGVDNDGDGTLDFDGGASLHGAPLGDPDPWCGSFADDSEADTSACGLLGAEVLPLLAFAFWRRRRRRRAYSDPTGRSVRRRAPAGAGNVRRAMPSTQAASGRYDGNVYQGPDAEYAPQGVAIYNPSRVFKR